MKISLALAALILLLGAALGLHDHRKLVTLRHSHHELENEALELGIAGGASAAADGSVAVSRRERERRDAETRRIGQEFIAFAKEMQQLQQEGREPDPEFQKRALALILQFIDFDASQLKAFIQQLRADPELNDETRQGLVGFSIMILAETSPEAALALFVESADWGDETPMRRHTVTAALSRLARENPVAAMDWIRKHGEKHPHLVNDETKRGILDGAARLDPKLAFSLIGDLGFDNPGSAAAAIGSTMRTPEGRTAGIEAMREHLKTISDESERSSILRGMMSAISHQRDEDMAATLKWMDEAALSPAETAAFGNGLHYHNTRENSGDWIGWMAAALPQHEMETKVKSMVENWTRQDFQSAGTWLAQAPDDAAKAPAVRSYAETVAQYAPETAEQWALTLPPGETRQETLKTIYERWPADEPDAKSAFGSKYGFDE